MPDSPTQGETMETMMVCAICGKPGSEADPSGSPGTCEPCYAKGWRTGPQMMEALHADPVLDVDEHGNVGLERHKIGVPRPPEEPADV